MPPGQRRRGFGLAGNPGILLHGHTDRLDRHTQGNPLRFQHPLLRRAGLFLLLETGHSRRLPGALQGHQGPYRPGRGRLSPRARAARPGRQPGRRPYLQPQRLRPHPGAGRTHQAGGPQGHPVSEGKRQSLPEDDRLLRGPGTRRPHEAGAHQPELRPGGPEPPLRHAHHRQRRPGPGATGTTSSTRNPSIPCWSPPRGCSPPGSMSRPAA